MNIVLNTFRVLFATCLGFSIATFLFLVLIFSLKGGAESIIFNDFNWVLYNPIILLIILPLYSGIIYYVNVRFSNKTHILRSKYVK